MFPQICFICTGPVIKKRFEYMHFLWNDELTEGLPICDECYFFLHDQLQDKLYLDYGDKVRREVKSAKRGIEQWL